MKKLLMIGLVGVGLFAAQTQSTQVVQPVQQIKKQVVYKQVPTTQNFYYNCDKSKNVSQKIVKPAKPTKITIKIVQEKPKKLLPCQLNETAPIAPYIDYY